MSVIFNKKAIILYGCAQVADGVSVNNSAPTGTITGTAIVFTANAAVTLAGGSSYKVGDNSAGAAFTTGLGPDNALPVLEATFSTDYTTEAFQYSGDELDRDEITYVKDMFGSLSFPIMMPSLGLVTQTMTYSAAINITATTGSTSATTSADATGIAAIGDYIYSYSKVLVGKIAAINTTTITFVDNAEIALTNKKFYVGKALSTPAYDDLPAPDWFQAAGFGIVLSTGKVALPMYLKDNLP